MRSPRRFTTAALTTSAASCLSAAPPPPGLPRNNPVLCLPLAGARSVRRRAGCPWPRHGLRSPLRPLRVEAVATNVLQRLRAQQDVLFLTVAMLLARRCLEPAGFQEAAVLGACRGVKDDSDCCFSAQDKTGQDRTGQDRTAQHRTGQDRTGQDRMGHDVT